MRVTLVEVLNGGTGGIKVIQDFGMGRQEVYFTLSEAGEVAEERQLKN